MSIRNCCKGDSVSEGKWPWGVREPRPEDPEPRLHLSPASPRPVAVAWQRLPGGVYSGQRSLPAVEVPPGVKAQSPGGLGHRDKALQGDKRPGHLQTVVRVWSCSHSFYCRERGNLFPEPQAPTQALWGQGRSH